MIVTVTALPVLVAVTALPTKSKLRTTLLNAVPSSDAVMFNPAPPPPPPASVDKSTEFPPEILNAFVPSLKDNVCESVFVSPPLPNPAAAALADVKYPASSILDTLVEKLPLAVCKLVTFVCKVSTFASSVVNRVDIELDIAG